MNLTCDILQPGPAWSTALPLACARNPIPAGGVALPAGEHLLQVSGGGATASQSHAVLGDERVCSLSNLKNQDGSSSWFALVQLYWPSTNCPGIIKRQRDAFVVCVSFFFFFLQRLVFCLDSGANRGVGSPEVPAARVAWRPSSVGRSPDRIALKIIHLKRATLLSG